MSTTEFLTSGTSYSVPAGVTAIDVACIGSGGAQQHGTRWSAGAGAFAATPAYPVTPGASIPYVIGASGTDTSWDSGAVLAKAGATGTGSPNGGGFGGQATSCVGTTRFNGGNGGYQSGGGGAGGPNGAGANVGRYIGTGATGDAGHGGVGGAPNFAGSAGAEYTSTAGPTGGSGGGGGYSSPGKDAGNFGASGGCSLSGGLDTGAPALGFIVLIYTASGGGPTFKPSWALGATRTIGGVH